MAVVKNAALLERFPSTTVTCLPKFGFSSSGMASPETYITTHTDFSFNGRYPPPGIDYNFYANLYFYVLLLFTNSYHKSVYG